MNFDLIALQCFIAVAETGSFTQAAQRVRRTQSAVSQQIKKLEDSLSVVLFIRGKSFALTPEGEIFLVYARRMFSLNCELIDRFKEPDLKGEVRFGLPENFASVYLSDVLTDFSQMHPRILLNIECDMTLNLFERFKKNEFDLVLVKMNRPQDFPNGVDIWSEPLKWVGDSNLINQTKPLPLVLSPKPCVYRASAIDALEKARIPWRLVFSSPSYTGVVAAVKAGLGITAMPHTMIPHKLAILEDSVLPKMTDTHISLLKHKADNLVINSLEKFVLKRFKP